MRYIRRCSLLVVATGSLILISPAHAGGFFDDLARVLFGRPAPPVYPSEAAPLGVTVRPTQPPHPRKLVASKPAPPVVKLDPATDPHWYLDDPTLRRGDIVVTEFDVLVFEGRGGQSHHASDFTALGKSRLVSKTTQQKVLAVSGNAISGSASAPQTAATRD